MTTKTTRRSACPPWCTQRATELDPHELELAGDRGELVRVHTHDLIPPEASRPTGVCLEATEHLDDEGHRLDPAAIVVYSRDGALEPMDPSQARWLAAQLLEAAAAAETVNGLRPDGVTVAGVDAHQVALLQEWAEWMQAAGMSRRTIVSRLALVAQVAAAAGTPGQALTWRQLAEFLGRDLKPTTRSTYHGDLRAWFGWLVTMGHRADDPTAKLHKPRQPRRQPRPITTPQLEQLLRTANRRRTRTMVLLAAYQGLRVHEIAKFRGEDILPGGLVVTDQAGILSTCDALRVLGKGGVEVLLPLHPVIAAEAKAYPTYGYWFPSYTLEGQPLTAKSVTVVLSKLADRAGVDATAHQLRHWYGTQVLRAAGGNLRVAQELLRHSNPATSAGYTHVDGAERQAALLGLPWITGLTPPPGSGAVLPEVVADDDFGADVGWDDDAQGDAGDDE